MATKPEKRICIVGGAGHVGLPLALVLADEGFTVDILDTNAKALETIKAGRMPFIENGAEDLLQRLLPTGRLSATADASAVDSADIVICVIGTPVDEFLTPQAHAFYRVIGEISPHFQNGQTLILRSTVYPGLSQRVHDLFLESLARFGVLAKIGFTSTATIHSDWVEIIVGTGAWGLTPVLILMTMSWVLLLRYIKSPRLSEYARQLALEGVAVLSVVSVRMFFMTDLSLHPPLHFFAALGCCEFLRRKLKHQEDIPAPEPDPAPAPVLVGSR